LKNVIVNEIEQLQRTVHTKNHLYTLAWKHSNFTLLIIPSTLQYGRYGIGIVLGNRSSTISRFP